MVHHARPPSFISASEHTCEPGLTVQKEKVLTEISDGRSRHVGPVRDEGRSSVQALLQPVFYTKNDKKYMYDLF